jgi:signal transduction histidine kinase/FixJ family two-component response regulator
VADVSPAEVWNEALRARMVSLVGVPLLSDGRLIGVLHVGTSVPRRFGVDDVLLLEVVAARVASAIEHARLFEGERQARADAEAANRAKDEFLGNLSHELRSPLSAIRTWAHLLRRGKLDDEKVGRALATIEESARLQARLIEDLLDVSRIVSGQLRMDARPVDLAVMVRAAVETVRLAADAKAIRLETRLEAIGGEVTGDAGRLQQVVWNLLSNAIKFTPRGGRVETRLTREGGEAVLRVGDTGEGIEPAFLPHVFQRFRQADSSSTRRHGGLGLGLAIVRHIVELHGGRVGAESAGTGQGATFHVRLPLSLAHELFPAPGLEPRPVAVELGGLQILVVDDEPSTLEAIAAVFEGTGAGVTSAISAAEGLAAFTRVRPSVVVSDIAMPGEDGYTLMRRLRALERGKEHTPAVALTAYAGVDDRTRAMEAGYDLHLAKPFEPQALIDAVLEVLARVGENGARAEFIAREPLRPAIVGRRSERQPRA